MVEAESFGFECKANRVECSKLNCFANERKEFRARLGIHQLWQSNYDVINGWAATGWKRFPRQVGMWVTTLTTTTATLMQWRSFKQILVEFARIENPHFDLPSKNTAELWPSFLANYVHKKHNICFIQIFLEKGCFIKCPYDPEFLLEYTNIF